MMHRFIVQLIVLQLISLSVFSQTSGEAIIEEFTSIARVVKNNKVGYVNGKGHEIIPVEFDEGGFSFKENRITLRKGENWFVYNVYGDLVLALQDRYKFVGSSGDDLFFVSNKVDRISKQDLTYYQNFDLSELIFIDLQGVEKFVIKPKFKLSIEYPSNLRYVNGYLKLDVAACETCASKLVGFADSTGQVVIEPRFHESWYGQDFSEGLSKTPNMRFEGEQRTYSTCKYGFINTKGEWVIDTLYSSHPIQGFQDGAAIVDLSTIEMGWGDVLRNKSNIFAINKKGERLFDESINVQSGEGILDSIMILSKMINDTIMYALGNTKGEMVTDFEYENIRSATGRYYEAYGYYSAFKNNESLYLSKKGEEIRFDTSQYNGLRIGSFQDGLSIAFDADNKSCVFNMNGNIVMPMSKKRFSIEGGIIREDIFDRETNKRTKKYYDRSGQAINFDHYDSMRDFEFIKVNNP